MPRIVGIDVPKEKPVEIALTYIYGIGRFTSLKILRKLGIDPTLRAKNLTEDDVSKIASMIQQLSKVEGDLKRDVTQNIKRLMDIGCYRGTRHKRSLPVRGQRTHTNARTRKGPRRTAGGNRKK